MLKTRIIPCLDVKDGRVVKGVNFVGLRDAGDPVDAARAYDAAGADELLRERGLAAAAVARRRAPCVAEAARLRLRHQTVHALPTHRHRHATQLQ